MKLLAADFDNTLLNNNDYKKNIEYINKFVNRGNYFAIVTGRHVELLLDQLKGFDLNYSYLICNDGGIIFDINGRVLYQRDIPKNVVSDIATIYENSGALCDWYIDTGLKITKDKNSTANGLIGRITDRPRAYALLQYIKDKYKEIDGYLSERWINIAEKSVSKGSGIKHLLKIINVNEKDVYTIGDNINDLSMSDYNFNAFRMTNSILELRGKTKRAYNSVYELVIDILKES